MNTESFYETIDAELDSLLTKYSDDPFIQKHKPGSSHQKSYALLIWFLEFYGKQSNYTQFITDGSNDGSCDIIFDGYDNQRNKVFYIVQSKWNNKSNSKGESDKDEILKALSDFETILRGGKTNLNPIAQKKIDELHDHLHINGEVKFVFLSLSNYKGGADDNIETFLRNQPKTRFEVIDINRIRIDYIDRMYKNITPINPLENYLDPEECPIDIDIVQLNEENNNLIKVDRPFEAYVMLIRPKTIYDLFEKYGFSLFHKNVRNPLMQSQFNDDIVNTASDNPSYFWYYNNGITAITYLLPKIRKQAIKLSLTGFQVINGAQTVYSVYLAYKSASPTKRSQMDNEALLTLRLLKTGGKDFDLNVTKFTNSQNPVTSSDFYANDDIQVRLQNESYNYSIWYEKRRGEFRTKPDKIETVPSPVFANVYLAYHLQNPVAVLNNNKRDKLNQELNFTSHRDNKDGFYETIFNSDTHYEDMLASFYIFDYIMNVTKVGYAGTFNSNIYHTLALFRTAFYKYLLVKYNDSTINISRYVINIFQKEETDIIGKILKYLTDFMNICIPPGEGQDEKIMKYLFSLSQFEHFRDNLNERIIDTSEIESIPMKKELPSNTNGNSEKDTVFRHIVKM